MILSQVETDQACLLCDRIIELSEKINRDLEEAKKAIEETIRELEKSDG